MNFVFWIRLFLSGFFGMVISLIAIAFTPKQSENLFKSIEVIALFLSLVAMVVSLFGVIWKAFV